jgi:hypothetical protein
MISYHESRLPRSVNNKKRSWKQSAKLRRGIRGRKLKSGSRRFVLKGFTDSRNTGLLSFGEAEEGSAEAAAKEKEKEKRKGLTRQDCVSLSSIVKRS